MGCGYALYQHNAKYKMPCPRGLKASYCTLIALCLAVKCLLNVTGESIGVHHAGNPGLGEFFTLGIKK